MTKKSIKILKFLSKNGETKYGDLSHIIDCTGRAKENKYIKELRDARYIEYRDPGYSQNGVIDVDRVKLAITVQGEAFLDARAENKFHFWLPIIISSAITIPGAYREELAQLGRALLSLLKTLTENIPKI